MGKITRGLKGIFNKVKSGIGNIIGRNKKPEEPKESDYQRLMKLLWTKIEEKGYSIDEVFDDIKLIKPLLDEIAKEHPDLKAEAKRVYEETKEQLENEDDEHKAAVDDLTKKMKANLHKPTSVYMSMNDTDPLVFVEAVYNVMKDEYEAMGINLQDFRNALINLAVKEPRELYETYTAGGKKQRRYKSPTEVAKMAAERANLNTNVKTTSI